MKVDFKNSWDTLMQSATERKPELLTGFGVGLMLAAIPLTAFGTAKAIERIKKRKQDIAFEIHEKDENNDILVDPEEIELSTGDLIKTAGPCYILPILTAGIGAFCAIASVKESLRRTAEALGMYRLSEEMFNKYREKTKEVVGDKKEDDINTRVMKDRMELMTDDEGHVVNIYDTRDGATLCFDYYCGRYFYSDIDFIKSRLNALVQDKLAEAHRFHDAQISLNEVYMAINLPPAGGPVGESLNWRIMNEGYPILRPTSQLVDDHPCYVLNFENPPTYIPSWKLDRM